jgi:hypothetical protein
VEVSVEEAVEAARRGEFVVARDGQSHGAVVQTNNETMDWSIDENFKNNLKVAGAGFGANRKNHCHNSNIHIQFFTSTKQRTRDMIKYYIYFGKRIKSKFIE